MLGAAGCCLDATLTPRKGFSVWAVPAATIAGPGLLILLWMALQAGGALAWLPAVRRLRGDRSPRR